MTVGVLENEDNTFATSILEIHPKKEWYDYEAKYTKGLSEFILLPSVQPYPYHLPE